MNRQQEFDFKTALVRALMRDRGWETVVLSTVANFAWLTGGGDSHVPIAADSGIAQIIIRQDAVRVVTNNVEAQRLRQEELAGLEIAVEGPAWHDDGAVQAARGLTGRVASDASLAGAEPCGGQINRLRYVLLPIEQERYRILGRLAGEAIAAAARAVRPGDTEWRMAARLSMECLERGLTPTALMAAADERTRAVRHPIPTDKAASRNAMLVLCARRHGLVASVTRVVHFGAPEADLIRRHDAVCRIDQVLIDATRPGARVEDIFGAAQKAYAAQGFPDEWELHHQGGATGYAGRDYKAAPGCQEAVLEGQAFAWNPSIAGTKSEDTILALAGGAEVLTTSPGWPIHAGTGRPDLLVI